MALVALLVAKSGFGVDGVVATLEVVVAAGVSVAGVPDPLLVALRMLWMLLVLLLLP